jgi:hypothetical protein
LVNFILFVIIIMNKIIYCYSADYKVFVEYLCCYELYGYKIIKWKSKTINNISKNNYNIFIRFVPDRYIDYTNVIINTEQVSNVKNFDIINKYIMKNIIIFDYSHENTIILKNKFPNGKIYHIPYLFMNKEINILKNYINNTNKYDIVFCGGLTDRRKIIIDELIKLNYSVLYVSGWNDDRDKLLASGKILLNIHANNDFNIFESIRCDRWIFSGLLVITEDSLSDNFNDLEKLLIISKYTDILETVKKVLSNYEEYYNNYNKIYQSEIQNIIQNRNEKYNVIK